MTLQQRQALLRALNNGHIASTGDIATIRKISGLNRLKSRTSPVKPHSPLARRKDLSRSRRELQDDLGYYMMVAESLWSDLCQMANWGSVIGIPTVNTVRQTDGLVFETEWNHAHRIAINDAMGHNIIHNGHKILSIITDATDMYVGQVGRLAIEPGNEMAIFLPDQSVIQIDLDGSYEIVQRNRRIIYQAASREFNPFVNASDLVARFIDDLADIGVTQQRVLATPIELFIHWLIERAAKQDGEQQPSYHFHTKSLQFKKINSPRCFHCGKFITKKKASLGVNFCNGGHLDAYVATGGVG